MKKVTCLIALYILLSTMMVSAKPNVVIFYADDFGWGDMRLHNTDPASFRYTPNLDKLFTEGVEFENYMTHCVCSPSRAGLLTGKHYSKIGSGPLTGGTLSNKIPNIAKDLKAAGYKTGAFGKWHNSKPNFPAGGNGAVVSLSEPYTSMNPLHQEKTFNLKDDIFHNGKGWSWGDGVNSYGFDRWVGYYNGGADQFDRFDGWHNDIDWWHDRHYRGYEPGYTTDLITKYACEFIQDNASSPFFCYIPQQAVHVPLDLKQSDLKEFCEKLESELGIAGQWDYVKKIKGVFKVNPATGERNDATGVYRTIEETLEIRADSDYEFSVDKIDAKKHYGPLMYAAYCYSLDKSIGRVIQKVIDIGQFENTIFVFSSDNGATKAGVNLPFNGRKGTLSEGGVHVPTAIWWPKRFDKNTAPYTPENNGYQGLISYLDLYPTLMSMTGNPLLGTDLDGKNCWTHLQKRTECRPEMTDAIYGIGDDHGTVRTNRWKLIYSESKKTKKLYDLPNDIKEENDVASANPEVTDQLITLYENWITKNSLAVTYLPIAQTDIDFPKPAPAGDVLEVKATQTGPISPKDAGVAINFSKKSDPDSDIWGGDRVEFDIYLCKDSTVTKGFYFSIAKPFLDSSNGLNQKGESLPNMHLPTGVWTRQVVGIGNVSPAIMPSSLLVLKSSVAGYYHYYMDNIIVRKSDGTIRSVIWQSKSDLGPLKYQYNNRTYPKLTDALAAKGFPFSNIEITAKPLSGSE